MAYERTRQPWRLPILPRTQQPIGLGDMIKAGTSALGIKPCNSCLERAARLNRLVTLVPRRQPPRG